MMHAPSHHTEESEPPQLGGVAGRRMHNQRCASLDFGRFKGPAVHAVHGRRVGGHHATNGVSDRTRARNGKPDSTLDRLARHVRRERDVVHVDEMLPERVDIHV